jgi:hypothetical protein
MVLDPFTALGLASNIVQFIDFASELFSKSKELAKSASGATKENEELEKATERLQRLCSDLKWSCRAGSKAARRSDDEAVLSELASECTATADDLLFALEGLRARGGTRNLQSFRKALQTVWKKDKIREMETKLAAHRRELTLRLTAMQEYTHL